MVEIAVDAGIAVGAHHLAGEQLQEKCA